MPPSRQVKPLILLWLDEAATYEKAIAGSPVSDRIEAVAIPAGQRPSSDLLARAAAVVAWTVPMGVIGEMPALRWVQTVAAGVDDWLARADLRDGIILTCARGTHALQMPDTILGALFYVGKPFEAARRQQKQRKWGRLMPEPLSGKTLGILGLGAVGSELARKAAAIGMRVIGAKRSVQPVPGVEAVYGFDEIDRVLRESDFVVLVLPATTLTENLIDARRLSEMKASAWLLNFGRGPLIVDEDLIAAVKAKRIAGAVLDVFREEPLPPEHPFWMTEGIVVLPHIGGKHERRPELVAGLFVKNLEAFLAGAPMIAVVERSRGY